MAGPDHLLNRIRSRLAGMDDAAWEALANRGLLRRARKDLERGSGIGIGAVSAEAVTIDVPPFAVVFTEAGPAKATCSCPAPGLCQHVVAAGLFLKRQEAPPPVAPHAAGEILAIDAEALRRWAGAAGWRAALALLAETPPPEVEIGRAPVVRFAGAGVEVHVLPGAGLDGMIVSRGGGRAAAVAAILALRRALGQPIETAEPERPPPAAPAGAARSRGAILATIRAMLREAVEIGTTHLSTGFVERLSTIAVSTLAHDLPRLAALLRTIADEIRSLHDRDATADEGRLLLALARADALAQALGRAGGPLRADLAGWHRARYREVARIEICGVAAYPWRTRSGFRGLTILFWAPESRAFLSWSDARRDGQDGAFDPWARFTGLGPWAGVESPAQAARTRLVLTRARRTEAGRISGTARTAARPIGPIDPATLDFGARLFRRWDALAAYASGTLPIGLVESGPLDAIVVVAPAAFGRRRFDPTSQALVWPVMDETGRSLDLVVPFDTERRPRIEALEALSPPRAPLWRIVGRLAWHGPTPVVEPLSILMPERMPDPLLHLAFAGAPPAHPPTAGAGGDPGEAPDDDEPIVEPIVEPSGDAYVDRLLSALERRLDMAGEAGAGGTSGRLVAWFAERGPEIAGAGLEVLAEAAVALSAASSGDRAGLVLRTRYLVWLHRQAVMRSRARGAS